MILMTDGLKGVAGESLKSGLEKMTGGTLKALFAGATMTTLVQSSSATTVATIGFVSAGLLRFEQAVGLIFGANLGTTSTGWMVALLGLKFKISSLALPLIGVGALMKLTSNKKLAAMGMAFAGFGLIFVGLDILQDGMGSVSKSMTPDSFPEATIIGRILLILIGGVMTIVMQSSSAAVAMTLVALSSGTIELQQAAALVIGQNVGSTVTAGLAAMTSDSVAAKRTALAHVGFNAVAGVVAFVGLSPFVWLIAKIFEEFQEPDPSLLLAAFHTAFNLIGVFVLVPLVKPFVRWIERVIPETKTDLARHLDPMVLLVPPVAVEASRRVLLEIEGLVLDRQLELLESEKLKGEWSRVEELDKALVDVREFLEKIHTTEASPLAHAQHVAMLHALDHVRQGKKRALEIDYARGQRGDDTLKRNGERLARSLRDAKHWLISGASGSGPDLESLARDLARARSAYRSELLLDTANGKLSAAEAEARLSAALWQERVAHHAWRAVRYLGESGIKGSAETHADIGDTTSPAAA
jgi:phosphate:Na+ symporter